MIISRIIGGLGNQLFAYAAARRLAIKNNTELVIDDVSGFARDFQYNRFYQLDHFNITARKATPRERLEPFGRYRRWLLRRYAARKPFAQRSYLEQETIDFDPRLLELRVTGRLYLNGYWQSEDYFKDIEQIIREDLQITPPDDSQNRKTYAQIKSCNSVALHVRWFNQPGSDEMNNLAGKYYKKAVQLMQKRIPDAHFFIFSDDPQTAIQRLNLPAGSATSVSHNQGDKMAYADLWLMSSCQHFIIANSSFSWWGAWLAENSDKIVVAPGFEIRKGVSWWGFDGLIPEEWIKL